MRNFLRWLETRQQIRQQKSNVTTIIELVNYSDYQSDTDEYRTADQTANRTAEKQQTRQQKNSRPDTYNNDKNENHVDNVKNEKNSYVCDFESLWLQYPPDNRRDKAKCKVIYERYCTSQQKEEQFIDAFKNYTQSKKFKEGFVQNSIVWFRDWQTWIDFQKFSGKTGDDMQLDEMRELWGSDKKDVIEGEVVR